MAVPKATLWERDAHTEGKLLVLENYLKAWFPIMARRNRRILFVDGFAGPGEYRGGEDGSPIIAMRAWAEHVAQPRIKAEVIFVFIEEKAERARHLERLVDRWDAKLPETAKAHVWPGTFDSLMTEVLDQLDEQKARMAPALVMMDPFGIKGIPIHVIQRILGEREMRGVRHTGLRSHEGGDLEGRSHRRLQLPRRGAGSVWNRFCRLRGSASCAVQLRLPETNIFETVATTRPYSALWRHRIRRLRRSAQRLGAAGFERSATHAAVVAAIVGTACQGDTGSAPDPFAADPWTLSDREARIGSVDDPDYIFNPVLRMALGPDGLLYTVHGGEATIRRWTADGAPAGSLGGKGEGPGEFQVPYQVGFFGDSLWVWDAAGGRVSYFDPPGEFLGSVAARADASWDVGPVHPIAPLRDGAFMWMRLPFFSTEPGTPEEIPFAKIDAAGRRLALIWAQPWEPHDAAGQTFGDAHLSRLGKRGLLVVDRRAWTGEGDATVQVSEIGFDGDTIFTAGVSYDPVPLTDERFDAGVRAATGGGASEARMRESMYRPPYLPAVGQVVGAEDGTIWLRRFDSVEVDAGEEVFEWWVLDGEGSPAARAVTPVGLDVRLITDALIWGLERDELDVEYIVRYRLIKE